MSEEVLANRSHVEQVDPQRNPRMRVDTCKRLLTSEEVGVRDSEKRYMTWTA
jgi:hypothetical protein